MNLINEKNNCCGCTACVSVCSRKAISMKPDTLGFLYPEIDETKCIDCGLCKKVCLITNDSHKKNLIQNSYAVINKNEEVRLNSSSGGIFSLIASSIINKGGIVFGVKMDERQNAVFDKADNLDDLQQFYGSKYVQAEIGNSYIDCKNALVKGRTVLFSGTPCQIAGLKNFLGKEYENLLCIDFICHGVPAPTLWKKYVAFQENKYASRTVKTAFRRKNCGWKQYSLSLIFANDSEYCSSLAYDKYLQIFLHDTALRESCYNCPAKGFNRFSDITLADFWGIENILPEFFDDKGTSLVLVNSQKGKSVFDSVKKGARVSEVKVEDVFSFNISLVKSVFRPKKRDQFEKNFPLYSMEKLYKKYGRDRIFLRVKKTLSRSIKKLLGDKGVATIKKILGR